MKTFVRMLVLCLVVPAGVTLAQDKPVQEKPAVTPVESLKHLEQDGLHPGEGHPGAVS